MKIIQLVSFLGIAFLTSASVAAHHSVSRATTPATDPQPVKMTCTILAAWTSSGVSVDPAHVSLTGSANRKDRGGTLPCGNSGNDCAPAIDNITGAPLEARVSGC